MRILATTDFHGNAEAFGKTGLKARRSQADVVVVSGDITHFGSLSQAKELLSFLNFTPVLFVPGNCDPPTLAKEHIDSTESIHGKCKQINNISFLGLGGSSPSPFTTPFELSEMEIIKILENAFRICQPRGDVVLVSHSPPRDTMVDIAFSGDHVGSFSVRAFVEKINPQLVLCGHIHEAIGIDRIGDVVIVNPGPARYKKCALIELDEGVKVTLEDL